jgi:hypothetical protein
VPGTPSSASAGAGLPYMPDLPPERVLELAAERARLVRIIGGAEVSAIRAAEQASLEAELGAGAGASSSSPSGNSGCGGGDGDGDGGDKEGLPQPQRATDGHSEVVGCQPAVDPVPASAAALCKTSAAMLNATAAPLTKRGTLVQPALPALAAAHYLLDFGCVVKGTTHKRRFKLQNVGGPGGGAVSFKWDRMLLEAWGLRVDPEVVAKLAHSGAESAVDVTFVFASGKRGLGLGPLELTLPIAPAKAAPAVLLTIRADVQVG